MRDMVAVKKQRQSCLFKPNLICSYKMLCSLDFLLLLQYFRAILMMKALLILQFLLLPIVLFAQSGKESYTPSNNSLAVSPLQETNRQSEKFSKVVEYIEKSLQAGSAEAISKSFAKKVSLNLLGESSGIYSLNQAYYIVRSFFERHKLIGVELNGQESGTNELFASGACTTLNHGKHETIKIYVGFIRTNKTFQISQLTIF